MHVLLTGGCGFIGSHTALVLLEAGHNVTVVDNLINSNRISLDRIKEICARCPTFYKIDVCDETAMRELFQICEHAGNPIEASIHFAGLKAVGESKKIPLEYYRNNLVSVLTLVKIMSEYNCKKFVFSSSATVYGNPMTVPISETFPIGSVTNPYAQSKVMIEQILRDIQAADLAWDIALLRYFNPVGGHPSGKIGENPKGVPNNLIPYLSQVAVGKLKKLFIFGDDYPTLDGTGIRDYIHVMDLAEGHLAALNKLSEHPGLGIWNLGTGRGYSVLEVVHAFEKVSGVNIPYAIADRRAGDVAICYADTTKAEKELNWKAKRGLEEMMQDSWNWQHNNPDGYI